MCARSHEWAYSSYRATVALEQAPVWLLVDEVLELFGPTPEIAMREVARLVHEGHAPVSDTL